MAASWPERHFDAAVSPGCGGWIRGRFVCDVSKAERLHLYLALLLLMQGGLMGTFASVDVFFFYFFHEFALIPTFIMIGLWGAQGAGLQRLR